MDTLIKNGSYQINDLWTVARTINKNLVIKFWTLELYFMLFNIIFLIYAFINLPWIIYFWKIN